MFDVYLGGVSASEWRKEFKKQISPDISVFDPYVENFDASQEKIEQIARELYFIDESNIIIFYIDNSVVSKSIYLQLGDALGNDQQTIVCLTKDVSESSYIRNYCEYRGVLITESIEELVTTTEEYAAEVELCNFEDNESD